WPGKQVILYSCSHGAIRKNQVMTDARVIPNRGLSAQRWVPQTATLETSMQPTEQPPPRCPTYEQLAAFSRGDLVPSELERLAAHVGHCIACETALGGIANDTFVGGLAGSAPLSLDAECLRLEALARASPLESAVTTGYQPATRAGEGRWAEEMSLAELG